MASTFAVFGDVHGRISLMLILARRWEVEAGRTLDGVLQVGDMGAFPDIHALDRATRCHAQNDPDELGYAAYLKGCAEGDALLGAARWPVVWVRGNHEDIDHLRLFQVPTPVDPWGKMWFVPDGTSMTIGSCRIAAMGGKPQSRRARHPPDPHSVSALAETAYAPDTVDILLSHAGPHDVVRHGSRRISALCARIRPRIHLFGHHHIRHGPHTTPSGQLRIGLDHLEFVGQRLQRGCWGILSVEETAVQWQWGDAFSWTTRIHREDYRRWIPTLTAGSNPVQEQPCQDVL